MSIKRVTPEQCREAAIEKCQTEDPEVLLIIVLEYWSIARNYIAAMEENELQREGLYDTVVACLVKQLGGEARIPRTDIEDPPFLYEDDDPITGEWIYETTSYRGSCVQ